MAGMQDQGDPGAGAAIWSAISIDIASTALRCARAHTSGATTCGGSGSICSVPTCWPSCGRRIGWMMAPAKAVAKTLFD
jgi:hypothetical protein